MATFNYHDFLAFMGIGGAHPGGISLTKALLKNEDITQNSRILDAGCGTGRTLDYIAQTYGCHVTAIDRHPVMIQKAKQRMRDNGLKADVIEGNIEDMPFPDASFDIILVESVTVFTDIDRSVSEFFRLLKDGGVLIDLEMTAIPPSSAAMMQAFQQFYGIDHIPTEKEWQRQFAQAGFHTFDVIHDNYVEQALHLQDNGETPEFALSDSIDPSIYQIWDEHQLLTEKYAHKLKYNVYRVLK